MQCVYRHPHTPQIIRLLWRAYTGISTGVALIGTVGAPVILHLFGGGIQTVAAMMLFASCVGVIGNLFLAIRLQTAFGHIQNL